MNAIELNTLHLRQRLSDVLNQVHSKALRFRIQCKGETVAWLIDDTFMQAIEQLLAADDSLSETLELVLDDELRADVEAAIREADAGGGQPLENLRSQWHGV